MGRLCAALGIEPARAVYGVVGGETPVRYLHEAALRIARGESAVAAVCGAEAEHAVQRAKRAGLRCPGRATTRTTRPIRGARLPAARRAAPRRRDAADRLPVLRERDLAAWGQTPGAGAGGVRGAVVAPSPRSPPRTRTPGSARFHAPEEIATPSPRNRLVAWPYLKLMVANPAVNQGAAVLLTSLARARAAGIPDHRLVHVWGGAAADEPRDYLARDHYHHSRAMEAVLERRWRWSAVAARPASTLSSSTAASPACRRWRGGRSASAEVAPTSPAA